MPLRPCLTCGTPTTRTRCDQHQREHQQQRRRPNPTTRGYDATHRAARQALAHTLPAPCAYGWCDPIKILEADGPWVAAHVVDGDPTAGWVAACRSCNEKAKHRPAPPGWGGGTATGAPARS